MRYLIDTNVVSALRIRGRNPEVERWAERSAIFDLYVSAMTVAEIERGVIAKERSDPEQGAVLRRWLEEWVLPAFDGRVLGFGLPEARVIAAYRVPEHAPLDDAIIAATAQIADLVVATRNAKHFEPFGVRVVNPWAVS